MPLRHWCRHPTTSCCYGPTEDYHGSNTIFLVGTLMSVVGGVFVVFATMALCYRSVVVHKNFSLCLRLVSRPFQVAIHVLSIRYKLLPFRCDVRTKTTISRFFSCLLSSIDACSSTEISALERLEYHIVNYSTCHVNIPLAHFAILACSQNAFKFLNAN